MIKHTPGPWRLDLNAPTSGYSVVAAAPKLYGGTTSICCPRPAYRTAEAREEAKANARLIAAAPEAIDALKALLAAAEQHIFGDECKAERDAARAAIAKAEGRA